MDSYLLKKIEIENYKSLEFLSIELGRFNVLIGENGCGKTNILESLVFASAGINENLENGILTLRGAKPTEARFLRSGFEEKRISENIIFKLFKSHEHSIKLIFNNDNQAFSKWRCESFPIDKSGYALNESSDKAAILFANSKLPNYEMIVFGYGHLQDYLIYAPENFFLRNSNVNEPYMEPVGSRGEGLLRFTIVRDK